MSILPSFLRTTLLAAVLGLIALVPGQAAGVAPGALSEAVAKARPGDVILLAPGDHGALNLTGTFGTKARPVTLRSANPADPARFSWMDLKGAEHLAIEDVVFNYRFKPGDTPHKLRPFVVQKSTGITLRRVLFDGDRASGTGGAADGYGAAFGLGLRWASDIVIENATFRTFHRGLVIGKSQGIILRNSDFYGMRSDGADFAEVKNLLIEGNHFHDFEHAPDSGDHPDMIQFWTAGTASPSTGITIRDNILNAGMGYWTQSLFMRNELVDSKKAGREMFYRDIEITGNVIINAHLHGITVGETDGLTIRNNTLIRSTTAKGMTQKSDGLATPSIRVKTASDKVTIRGNLVANIDGADKRPDWQVSDNLAIDARKRGSALYYDRVFLSALHAASGDLGHYAYRADGAAAQTGFGSPLLRPDRVGAALRDKGAPAGLLAAMADQTTQQTPAKASAGLIGVEPVPGTPNRFRFSAETKDPQGLALWQLADGQKLQADRIEVDFPQSGRHRVTLVSAAGATAVEVTVPDPRILRLSGGTVSAKADLPFVRLPGGGMGLSLGQGKEPASLPASALRGLFEARQLAIDLRIKADPKSRTPGGEVMRIHGHVALSITPTGAAEAWLHPADSAKPVVLRSPPLRLHDGVWHDIGLRYDADRGEMALLVDGTVVGRKPAQGALRPGTSHGLSFGNPFGKKSFDGMLSDLTIIATPGPWANAGQRAKLQALP